jgi:hypothetical protein
MEASCRETFVIIDNGGLSDKGIALMQGFQHMNSIIKAEFKSVADKIRLRRGPLIVVKLIREYRQQPNGILEFVLRLSKFANGAVAQSLGRTSHLNQTIVLLVIHLSSNGLPLANQ